MTKLKRTSIAIFALNALLVCSVFAQYYNVPLTMEGLDNRSNASVVSKSMGGVTIPLQQNISLMFANPAGLSTLDGIQISVGGTHTLSSSDHTQQWKPMVYFGNISILMDGTARNLTPTGVPYGTLPGGPYPGDTLRKPYDDIWPAWSHNQNKTQMPDVFVAMPLTIGDKKASVGIGMTDYASLDYFYKNNNTLSADFGLMVIPNAPGVRDSVRSNWSQNTHYRMGAIHSYGAAFSIAINDNFSAGVSGRYLKGSSDDYDISLGRGVVWVVGSVTSALIWNVNNGYIRCDSVDYLRTLTGKSDFTGHELTASGTYRNKNLTVGVSVTLPSTITREFSGKLVSDTAKTIDYAASYSSREIKYTEKMNLPIKLKFGIGLNVRSNVFIAAEYEYAPYSLAEVEVKGPDVISEGYTWNTTRTRRPWMDASSFHFGADWSPIDMLAIRFGYREQRETFHAEYSALNDPINSNAYSFGVGVKCMPNLVLNLAYEYYERKYEDAWVYNTHFNTMSVNTLSAELVYTLK